MKKITIYDPSVQAYREYSLSEAKKFVESAEKAKKQIEKAEKKEEEK